MVVGAMATASGTSIDYPTIMLGMESTAGVMSEGSPPMRSSPCTANAGGARLPRRSLSPAISSSIHS